MSRESTAEGRPGEADLVACLDTLTPQQWLAVMRYFGRALARDNQRLLIELVGREARRRAGDRTWAEEVPLPPIQRVLRELDLRLVVTLTDVA